MNIVEFRKKYPEYSDISDIELTEKLHQKYYSDVDIGVFTHKFIGEKEPIPQTELSPAEKDFSRYSFLAQELPINQLSLVPTPEEPTNIVEKLKWLGKQGVAGAETTLALGSGAVLWPFSKTYGLMALPWGENVARMAEEDIAKLGYQPYTKEAQEAVELVSKAIEFGLIPAHKAGKAMEEAVGPRAGYLTELIGELLTFKGVHGVGKALTGKPKAPPKTAKMKVEEARKAKLKEKLEIETEGKPLKTLVLKEELLKKKPFKSAEESARVLMEEELAAEKPSARAKILEKLTKKEREVLSKKPTLIEGTPISPEERLFIKTREDFIDKATERIGGKAGIREREPYYKARDEKIFGKKPTTTLESGGLQTAFEAIESLIKKHKKEPRVIKRKGKEIPYAQSINLEKQDLPKLAKDIELMAQGQKKTQTWDQTGKLSKELMSDLNKTNKVIKKARGGEGLTAVEIDVMRQINANAVDSLQKMAESGMSVEKFKEQFGSYKENLFKPTSDASSEIGRALNIHKKVVSPNRIARAFSKLEKGLNKRQLDDFSKLNLDNPIEVENFLRKLSDPTLKDYFFEYWYNSILSGPPTHVVNIASNTAWSLYQIPHHLHTAMWDKVWSTFTGKARTRYVNEIIPMMAGYGTGFKRGKVAAKEMMRTGEIGEFETKWAKEIGYGAIGAWERSPHAWMRKISPAVSFFTRGLRAMDVWANSMSYDAKARMIARQVSNKKGLTGKEREVFERKYLKNFPDNAHETAMRYAKHNTFMDDPDAFTNIFIQAREVPAVGPILRFGVIPFVNTLSNLLKRGLELTPGVGIAKELASAKGMKRGFEYKTGTSSLAEMTAKQIEGSILALYILSKCDKLEITGPVPSSKSEREAFYRQNKKPWAIKVGDTYYQYRRIEPWNTVIASVAIAYDKIKNAKDEKTRTEIFGEVVRGIVDNVFDSSYFQGIQRVFNKHETFKETPYRMGASLVPYSSFWRSINRSYEKATEGKVTVKEKVGWLNALSQVIPGLSGKIPAQLNIWGEEKVIPGSIFQHWLPYKWSKEKDDPTEKELARLGVYPGQPKRTIKIKGEDVYLNDAMYRNYCLDFGHKAKARLDSIVTRMSYKRIKKDKTKISLIDKVLSRYRIIARKRVIREYLKKNK